MASLCASDAPSNLQKCGEISTNLALGRREFYLGCLFCDCVFLQLDNFMLHMEQQHLSQLYDNLRLLDEVEEHIEITIEQTELDDCKGRVDAADEEHVDVPESLELKYMPRSLEVKEELSETDAPDPLEEPVVGDASTTEALSSKQVATTTTAPHNIDSDEGQLEEHLEEEADEDGDDVDGDSKLSYSDTESNTSDDTAQSAPELDLSSDGSERQLLSAIIDGYKQSRILWDPNEPVGKHRKKREDAFRQIAASVSRQTGQRLQWKQVGERIKKLRYKFRSELQSQQLAESKGEGYVPSWYYEQLSFLNASIKHRQRKQRGAKALASDKSALPLSKLTNAQNLELIDIYKSYPCLWDVQHIGYRFKNQRQEALADMRVAIKERLHLSFSEDELQKMLYRIRHACTQEKHRKLQCERAAKPFRPACKYYEQIAFLMDNVGPFKCPYCEQTFNGADQYKIHKSQHDGSMPFTCPLCQRGFMKVGNCTVHLRRHTRDYPFECRVCKKRYATSTDVNVHMRHHTGEKPYFCDVCGQSFRTWTFFDAHMRRHQKRPSHQCSICAKGFYENSKLTEHMKAHLNVRDQVCNVCGKAFTSSKYLRQHKQIHAEKKKYTCKICGKDFAQYAGLSGHMKSHGTTMSGSSGSGSGGASDNGGASGNGGARVDADTTI